MELPSFQPIRLSVRSTNESVASLVPITGKAIWNSRNLSGFQVLKNGELIGHVHIWSFVVGPGYKRSVIAKRVKVVLRELQQFTGPIKKPSLRIVIPDKDPEPISTLSLSPLMPGPPCAILLDNIQKLSSSITEAFQLYTDCCVHLQDFWECSLCFGNVLLFID